MATATGYEAFFSNPAGFRSPSGEVTALSLSPWFHGSPAWGQGVEAMLLDEAADGGVGLGGSVGVAYAGRGLGLGLFFSGGAQIQGAAELSGDSSFQLGLTVGYSYAFSLFGLNVALGTSVRPLLRVEVPLDDAAARDVIHASAMAAWPLFEALWLEDALFGVGLAADVGVLVDAGRLRVGAAVTDVGGTTFRYSRARFGDLVSQIVSLQGIPDGASTDEGLTIPMLLRVGAAYSVTPALQIHLEIRDPFSVIQGETALTDSLHGGLEFSPGKGVTLWLGMAGTTLSAGAGWRFGPLQTSLAIHGLDLNVHGIDSIGIAAETAIRF